MLTTAERFTVVAGVFTAQAVVVALWMGKGSGLEGTAMLFGCAGGMPIAGAFAGLTMRKKLPVTLGAGTLIVAAVVTASHAWLAGNPLAMAALMVPALGAVALVLPNAPAARGAIPTCSGCGYPTVGRTSAVCPECGRVDSSTRP